MDTAIISGLKQQLSRPLPGREAQLKMAPSFRPEISQNEHAIKAGVLILLYPNPIELHLVFMKRPAYEGIHSAQISFPGGKSDPIDKSIIDTAIRETNEEIGVLSDDIQIIGILTPLYIPISKIEVFPAVGFSPQKPVFRIDPNEVDFLIEEPVVKLLNPRNQRVKTFSSEKYTGQVPYYDVQGNEVWGATAMILSEFLELLNNVK